MTLLKVIILQIFVTLYNQTLPAAGQYYDCDSAYECQGQSLSSTSTELIRCEGYHSCDNASITANGAYEGWGLLCRGAYSCYKAPQIVVSAGYFGCTGLLSCARSNYLYSPGYVMCIGEKSCAYSTIYHTSSAETQCDGVRSCKGSTIYESSSVEFRGLFSGENAVVSSQSSISVTIWNGDSAPYLTILCNNGHTCTINCYGNGCNDGNYITFNDSNGGTFSYNCDDSNYPAYVSTVCPSGLKLSEFMTKLDLNLDHDINNGDDVLLPSLRKLSFSLEENVQSNGNYDPCSATNSVHCIDNGGCQSSSSTSNILGPVCCSAYYACYGATEISTSITDINLNANNVNNTAIRCDGDQSCRQSYIIANFGGDMYFTAAQTGRSGSGIYGPLTNNSIYGGALETNIICTSGSACGYNTISEINILYCIAPVACGSWSSRGYLTNINKIYAYSRGAIISDTITNVLDSIYCSGQQACSYNVINIVKNDLICQGSSCLVDTTISHVGGSVITFGQGTMKSSTITNVTNVC